MPVSLHKNSDLKPYWQSECGRATLYLGDNMQVMLHMQDSQFHAVVTDPPYGLEFMGKEWDAPWKNSGVVETANEGTDKSHPFRDGTQRVRYGNKGAVVNDPAKERGGFQDGSGGNAYSRSRVEYGRDSMLFQQWFFDRATQMLRVSKLGAHLLSFGGTRMWHRMACAVEDAGYEVRDCLMWLYSSGFPKSMDVSKRIDKIHGVERVDEDVMKRSSVLGGSLHRDNIGSAGYRFNQEWGISKPVTDDAKRWSGWGTALKPAWEPVIMARKSMDGNTAQCVLEHGTGALNIDVCRVGDSGGTGSRGEPSRLNAVYGDGMGGQEIVDIGKGRWPANVITDGSEEQLSRYFYSAKADSTDRPHGKGGHPTVKPLDLMRYLVKMVCPRGGVVLDPFMGSGSTGVASLLEGMNFFGIEQSQEYADIAVGRLKLALESAPNKVELITKVAVPVSKDAPPTRKLRLK